MSYLREVYDIDKVLSRQYSIRNLNFGKKVNKVLISRSPVDFWVHVKASGSISVMLIRM